MQFRPSQCGAYIIALSEGPAGQTFRVLPMLMAFDLAVVYRDNEAAFRAKGETALAEFQRAAHLAIAAAVNEAEDLVRQARKRGAS